MSWSDLAIWAIALAVFAGGVLLARTMGRALVSMRARRQDQLEHRGSVHGSDMILRVSLIAVWAGGAFGSLCLLPAAAWVGTGDREALEIAARLFGVAACIVGIGVLAALSGMRLFLLEGDRITRSGPLRERSIRFEDITRLREAGTFPSLRIEGAGTSIRLPKTVAGFDDIFNRLVAQTDPNIFSAPAPATEQPAPSLGALTPAARYAVTRRRLGINIGILTVLFVACVGWPWFVVNGEHPVRDAFFFAGMSLLLWLGIYAAIRSESLQPDQPIELELHPETIRWRRLRGSWVEHDRTELVSSSVETTIIYVKGQSGHRYPLRLRFVDGTVVKIDDFRARHFGSSTQLLGHDIRRRYVTTEARRPEDELAAAAHVDAGRAAEQAGDTLAAVAAYEQAIGAWPSAQNLALHRHLGELLRVHADALPTSNRHERIAMIEVKGRAIGHFRAHVDQFPTDADAWQGIGAALAGNYRTDLADEAIESAEQLLLSGRAESTTHLLDGIIAR